MEGSVSPDSTGLLKYEDWGFTRFRGYKEAKPRRRRQIEQGNRPSVTEGLFSSGPRRPSSTTMSQNPFCSWSHDGKLKIKINKVFPSREDPCTPLRKGQDHPETTQWICTPDKLNPLKLTLSRVNVPRVVPLQISQEEEPVLIRKEEISGKRKRCRKMSHPSRWPYCKEMGEDGTIVLETPEKPVVYTSPVDTTDYNDPKIWAGLPMKSAAYVRPAWFFKIPPPSEVQILTVPDIRTTWGNSPKMPQNETLVEVQAQSPSPPQEPEPEISYARNSVSPKMTLEPKILKQAKAIFPRKPRMLKRIESKSFQMFTKPRNTRTARPMYARVKIGRKPRSLKRMPKLQVPVPPRPISAKLDSLIISPNPISPRKPGRPRLFPKVETISAVKRKCPCVMCTSPSQGSRAKRTKRVDFDLVAKCQRRESLPLPLPQDNNIEYKRKAKSFPPAAVKEKSLKSGKMTMDNHPKPTQEIQQYECTVCKGIITYRSSEFWNPHEVCGNHSAEQAKNNLANPVPRAGDDVRWDIKFEIGTPLPQNVNERLSGSTCKARIISGPEILPPNSTWTLVPPKRTRTQYSIKYAC